jgi:hypothetical protein
MVAIVTQQTVNEMSDDDNTREIVARVRINAAEQKRLREWGYTYGIREDAHAFRLAMEMAIDGDVEPTPTQIMMTERVKMARKKDD